MGCVFTIKKHIPLLKRDDICFLDNCLVMEIRSENEKYFLPVFIILQAKTMMNFKTSV